MKRKELVLKQKNHSSSIESKEPPENTMDTLRKQFEQCSDVHILKKHIVGENDFQLTIIYCEELCNYQKAVETIIPHITFVLKNNQVTSDSLEEVLEFPIKKMDSTNIESSVMFEVFSGNLIFFIKELDAFYLFNFCNIPKRSIEEPNTEVSIKGPKEGFIETLSVNIALIRKRLKSNTFKYEQIVVGERSNTRIGLLYISDIADPDLISNIKDKIKRINYDGIISTDQLTELINGNKKLFPMFMYTGRPDFVVDSLLHGRFTILIDGLPTAIIGPTTLSFLLKSPEDAHSPFLLGSFGLAIRYLSLIISLFLPGFWLALMSYHTDQIPYSLLATILLNRQGVPLPVPIEVMIMALLFELFKEAGLRMPTPFGQTLSVVGGLIIGQAAISAGLTAPTVLVVIAISMVATYTIGNQELNGIISIIRIMIILTSSILGLLGYLLSVFFFLTYLVNLHSFGVPYLTPFSPIRFKEVLSGFIQLPWNFIKRRPGSLNPTDPKRQGDS
ncbi:spore germination protein [Neobacillus drentensis]|uniref:spore germination protein n=1 Tax=Neobacillus drentensis TaxID=220684 RepID=UPI003000F20A